MERKPALGADLAIPALALGFTAYFLYSVAGLEWEAKANGVIVGTVLLALIAVQVARVGLAAARGKSEPGFGPLLRPREALPKRIGMILITIVFVAAVPWLGLALGLFLALAAGLYVMGVRGRRVVFVSLAVALVSSLLFTAVLESNLPKGPVENLVIRLLR